MRLSVRLALLTIAATFAGTTSAQAVVTESHVTSPSDPTYILNQQQPFGTTDVAYAGTSNGTTGDELDLYCTYGANGTFKLYGATATVREDGSFSGTIPMNAASAFGLQTCVLRAMPDESASVDRFTGPVVGLSQVDDEEESRPRLAGAGIFGPNPMDFFVAAAQLRGYVEWRSVSSCGLTYSYPYDETFAFDGDGMVASEPLFNCAGALYPTGTGDDRSQIRIDGVSVVTGYGAHTASSRGRIPLEDYPEPTHVESQDPTTGDVTITETEPLLYCRDSTDTTTVEPSTGTCRNLQPANARLVRTIQQRADGLQMTVTDSFVNEDDSDRTITAIYDQHIGRDATPETSHNPTRPTFSFGGGAYEARATGTVVTPDAQAPGVIGIQGDPNNGTGLGNPQGSIVYSTAPSEVTFNYANDMVTNASTPQADLAGPYAAEFEMRYERPLPASGSVDFTHVYTQATTRSEADRLTAAATGEASTPALAIESPADGAIVSTPTIAVSGTASDRSSAVTLTVNGVDVPVVDGRWNTSIALSPGANTITAVATNAADRQTQVTQTVVFTPGLLPGDGTTSPLACVVPALPGTPESLARLAIGTAGCTVGQVHRSFSAQVAVGLVISSSPAAGVRLAKAHPVDLVVSRGPASSKFRVPSVKVAAKASGKVDVNVVLPGAGRFEVLGTYGPIGRGAKSRAAGQMKLGPLRRLYARQTGTVRRGKDVVVHLVPTKAAKASLRLHRKRGQVLTVRVHVRYAPVDGKPAQRLVKTLRLR